METPRRRLVLVPFPFQGHLTPMLQVGAILHSRGFSISIAHTQLNFPDPALYPDFVFLPLPDGIARSDIHFHNMLNVMSDINTNCISPFHDHLVRVLEERDQKGELACVIYDSIMHFAHDVANHLNIPTIVLRTNSAAYVRSSRVALQLVSEKLIPLPESQHDDLVPGVGPLRFKDLPIPAAIEIPEAVQDFTRDYTGTRSSSAVIWNSLDMLEHEPLQQLQQHDRIPFYTIGPFHKLAPSLPTSLTQENTKCLWWLDAQAPNTVVYVSLGSVATIDRNDFIEMAWGLANSRRPFLWVVRDSLVNGSRGFDDILPDKFKEETRERGCIVSWAPQKEVLAHGAVGGFLSHCGWNSTLESLSEGVPVLCRPCFSDQLVNARYLTQVWKVGLELEHVERSCVAQAVRMLMVGEEGQAMRDRALAIKQQLDLCINSGGSSFELLDQLVKFVVSLSLPK